MLLHFNQTVLLTKMIPRSGVARGAVRPEGCVLDKFYVIAFLNYFEQPLLSYIAYLLIGNYPTVLPSAQTQSCRNGPCHLVYALEYSHEYKKDLMLMCVMSQMRTVFFFVFALFESLTLSLQLQYRYKAVLANNMGARRGVTVPYPPFSPEIRC